MASSLAIPAGPLLLVHLVATLYMLGLIWFVQVVHYPLFAHVGRGTFPDYARGHTSRTAWVVGPPMLVEAASALLLVTHRPEGVPEWLAWAGLGLLLVVWVSTAAVQIPCHNRLALGPDPAVQRRLVASNWVRTIVWTLRAGVAVAMVAGILPG